MTTASSPEPARRGSFLAEACWSRPWLWRWGSLGWAACFFVFAGDAGMDFPVWIALGGAAFFLAFVWLLVLLHWLGRRRRGLVAPATRRAVLAWWTLPGAAVLLVALAFLGVPMRVRFGLSEDALTRYASEIRAGRDPSRERELRVGLYHVRSAHAEEGCVFLTTSEPFLYSAGFVHSPDGAPRSQDTRYVYGPRVGDHWWVFLHDDF